MLARFCKNLGSLSHPHRRPLAVLGLAQRLSSQITRTSSAGEMNALTDLHSISETRVSIAPRTSAQKPRFSQRSPLTLRIDLAPDEHPVPRRPRRGQSTSRNFYRRTSGEHSGCKPARATVVRAPRVPDRGRPSFLPYRRLVRKLPPRGHPEASQAYVGHLSIREARGDLAFRQRAGRGSPRRQKRFRAHSQMTR